MNTARVQGVALLIVAALFAIMTVVAFRVQRRTGVANQWRFIAPVLATVSLALALAALGGHVLAAR